MRYLVCYIDPKTGRERLGTGAAGQTFANYANVDNVIKFHIGHENFPPGQYNIYVWPLSGTLQDKPIRTAYKKVPAVTLCNTCGALSTEGHKIGCDELDRTN